MSFEFGDLKYSVLSDWVEDSAANPINVEVMTNPPFIAVAKDTFADNFDRLITLATAPEGFLSVGMKLQLALDVARFRLFNRVEATTDDDLPEVREKILEESNRIMPTLKRYIQPETTMPQADALRVDHVARQLKIANDAVSAIYSNLILGAWMVFESLASDLWIAALDSYPKDLSKMEGSKKRISSLSMQKRGNATQDPGSEKDKQMSGKEGKDKQISLPDIHKVTKGDFNLANKMGTLLREKYEFDSLEKIRVAYSLAFAEHSHDIDDVLADSSLDALSAVRNLIAHNAGYANQEYLDRMKSVPGIPPLELKQRLELNGEWVVNLIGPIRRLGYALLTNVTRWIKNH
jgi:hypothetical protein